MAERSSQQEVTRAEDNSFHELHELLNAEDISLLPSSSTTKSIYGSTKFYTKSKAALKPGSIDERHLIIAGLSRSGKSTALNNIFDLNLEANLSAGLVTKQVSISTITKEVSTSEKEKITFRVADTPGLMDAKIDKKAILNEISKFGIQKEIVLLLTLPVSLTSTITSDYSYIINNLTFIFDKKIWNHCICLLTCSDSIHESDFKSDSGDYQLYLKGHCEALQKELDKCFIKKKVKLFFEYDSKEKFENTLLDGIVAMPVGMSPAVPTKCLLPSQLWTHNHNWTDLLFTEIAKLDPKGNCCNKVPIGLRLGVEGAIIIGGVTGGAIGAAIGGKAGGAIGTTFGPFGAIAGAAVGMIGGALAGEILGA